MIPNLQKPPRGSHTLARMQKRAEYERILEEAKRAAKHRDGWKCRWPIKHLCRSGLEAAHIVDASLGGEPHPSNLWSCCAWIHRLGPQSVHQKLVKVEPETSAGADGAMAFYVRASVIDEWTCVAVELAIGRVRKL